MSPTSLYLAGALLMLCCLELWADPAGSWETGDLTRERERERDPLSALFSLLFQNNCVCVGVYLRKYRRYGCIKGQLTVGQTLDKAVGGAWVQYGPWLAADRRTLTLRLNWPTPVFSPGCKNTNKHTHTKSLYLYIKYNNILYVCTAAVELHEIWMNYSVWLLFNFMERNWNVNRMQSVKNKLSTLDVQSFPSVMMILSPVLSCLL